MTKKGERTMQAEEREEKRQKAAEIAEDGNSC
jgi:hypothetical protein